MTDNLTTPQMRSVFNVALKDDELEKLRAEAVLLDISLTKLMRDYSLSYLQLKEEAMKAIDGKLQTGSLLQIELKNIEGRQNKVMTEIANQAKNIEEGVRTLLCLTTIFLRYWSNHTAEVPQSERMARGNITDGRLERISRQMAKELQEEVVPILKDIHDIIIESSTAKKGEQP